MQQQTSGPVRRPAGVSSAVAHHCHRCGGNLFLSQEDDTWEATCLQCGRSQQLVSRRPPVVVPVSKRTAA